MPDVLGGYAFRQVKLGARCGRKGERAMPLLTTKLYIPRARAIGRRYGGLDKSADVLYTQATKQV